MSNSRGLRTKTTTLVTFTLLIITVLAVSMVVVSTNGMTDKLVLAQGALKKFSANLSGKSEVPPVDTKASGTAQFQMADDMKLNEDLNNFMSTFIGKSGKNGPPIVMLAMGKGKITSGDLQGPLSGEQLSDLAKLMQDRNTYVNVHTQQNQNGEIRGQIAGS